MERCGLKRSTKKTNSVVIVSTEVNTYVISTSVSSVGSHTSNITGVILISLVMVVTKVIEK